MSGTTAFLVAICGTLLICYLLMNRMQNRKPRRESAGGDSYGTTYSDSSGSNGWNLFSWSSSDGNSDSSSSHDSASSSDSGGDSGGGGGDGGGGGGGD